MRDTAELFDLTGHTENVGCLAFHPDGKLLASGSLDKRVKVWDATTGTEVASFDGERQSYQQSPPRACAPAAIVDSSSRPLILETQIGNDWRATALAPDAVTAVQVNYADGSSEPVDVHGNGFHLKLRMQLLNITYTDASGSHTTEPASQ